jgi:hypothetical protein
MAGNLFIGRCGMILTVVGDADMTNVFKIRHGKETHVYRTENPSDKKSLLGQFRQVAEELAAKKRKEREGEHERRKSLLAGGDVSVITHTLFNQNTDPVCKSVHLLLGTPMQWSHRSLIG